MLNSQRSLSFREVWAPTGTLYKTKWWKHAWIISKPRFSPMMSHVELNSLQGTSLTNDGVILPQPLHCTINIYFIIMLLIHKWVNFQFNFNLGTGGGNRNSHQQDANCSCEQEFVTTVWMSSSILAQQLIGAANLCFNENGDSLIWSFVFLDVPDVTGSNGSNSEHHFIWCHFLGYCSVSTQKHEVWW